MRIVKKFDHVSAHRTESNSGGGYNYAIPYSGYNLRGAISANHQISYLEVIFAIIKFANHSMCRITFCMARSIYAPGAYRYFDYLEYTLMFEPSFKQPASLQAKNTACCIVSKALCSYVK